MKFKDFIRKYKDLDFWEFYASKLADVFFAVLFGYILVQLTLIESSPEPKFFVGLIFLIILSLGLSGTIYKKRS